MNPCHSRSFVALLVSGVLTIALPALAAVSNQLRYQGVLTDSAGVPLDGTYTLTFRLYTAPLGGVLLWSETQPAVVLDEGLFGVLLGSVTPVTLPFDQPYWLSIQVGSDGEMSPRQAIASVPTARRAEVADAVAPDALVPVHLVGNRVGIGTTTPAETLDVAGTLQTTGFKLPTGAAVGAVLTSDTSGVGAWQAAPGGGGGWTDDGAIIRLTTPTDNVGIGVASPQTKLHVVGSARVEGGSLTLSNDGNGRFEVSHWSGLARIQSIPGSGGGGEVAIQREVPGAVVSNTGIYDGTNTRIAWFDGATRNVGIGTDTPSEKLHVAGNAQVDGTIRGATYGFGGAYQQGGGNSCVVTNPATGLCTCPSGFSPIWISQAGSTNGYVCFR